MLSHHKSGLKPMNRKCDFVINPIQLGPMPTSCGPATLPRGQKGINAE
jgi:hypothetical protein